jgi:hypothetical protein
MPGAALKRGGSDLVRHAALVAGGPGRRGHLEALQLDGLDGVERELR